ncbi:MAG TPA: TSUP family transporter [Verrucomicrobiae bacterium]|jgi:hypothetical protein
MIEWWQVACLFATGLIAGFVDSIAGGGGLITLPVLMSMHIDPRVALGTNKLQATFGSGSATVHYARAGAVKISECRRAALLAFLGAASGSLLVQYIDANTLKRLIPVLLILVAIYLWLKPQLGEKDIHPRMSRTRFDFLFGFGIGFYDGFLGPGTGTFLTMAFMLGLGFNLTKATASTKVLNFATNIASLTIFLIARKVWFAAGLAMGLGQFLGARIGSKMVMRGGTKFIRPIFLSVVIILMLKMIYDSYLKPHH